MHEMLNQSFGVEIETYNLSRSTAAVVVANSLAAATGRPWRVHHRGGVYDAYLVLPNDGAAPVWTIERDASIQSPNGQSAELVTPVLTWSDMPMLQQLLRDLRKAGARSDPAHLCGIHVHVDGSGHTPLSLRNLANLMASHEQLLMAALALDSSRVWQYAKPVNPVFLTALNQKKPKTMTELQDLWYAECPGADRAQHYNPSRYHMLNLHSLFTGKGLEFRLFQFDNFDPDAPRGRRGGIHAGQLKAYVQLCLALSYRAKIARSSSPRVLHTDNPRYAMRCWLLRLGFIGDDFATAREVFTRRLSGDCAFRHGRPKDPDPQTEAVPVETPGPQIHGPVLSGALAASVSAILLDGPDLLGRVNCRHSLV